MNHLKSLNFTTLPTRNHDPKLMRRVRLIERLEEQRRLAQDPTLAPIVKRWKKTADGSKALVDHYRRLTPWWRTDVAGNVVLTVRSGLKAIEFEKGKAGIAVGKMERLDGVISTLIEAARNGELDTLLAIGDEPARGIPKLRRG